MHFNLSSHKTLNGKADKEKSKASSNNATQISDTLILFRLYQEDTLEMFQIYLAKIHLDFYLARIFSE